MTTEQESNSSGEEDAAERMELAEAQAEYQRALEDKDQQVNTCRLLLFVICGILALLSFISGIIYDRPERKEALPYDLDNPPDRSLSYDPHVHFPRSPCQMPIWCILRYIMVDEGAAVENYPEFAIPQSLKAKG